MTIITGEILLPPDVPNRANVRIVVRLRDHSSADRLPPLLGSSELRIDLAPGISVPFEIETTAVPTSGAFNLEAHVDFDGSGLLSPGDLITMRPFRVLADGTDPLVGVRVMKID